MVLNFEGVGEEEYQQFFTTSSTVGRGTTRRAVRLNAISLSFHKEMAKEREPKGLMPFGFPQRANVASLSLRSYLREGLQFQLLRWRFKEKRQHGSRTRCAKAKTFAICDAP